MHGLLEQNYGHPDTMDARCSSDYQQHAAILASSYEYPEAIPNGSSWQYVADETARGLVQSVPPEKCDYSQLYHQYPYISTADRVTTWLSATEAGLPSQFMTVPDYTECGNLYLHSPESESSGASRCGDHKKKRKRVQTPSQRKAANVRERRRMFHLNEAFDDLRKRLPAFNYEKRLSRIETLRLAITYISFMEDLIDGKEPSNINLKACKSRDLNALFNNVLSVGDDQHDDDVDCDDDEDMNI